MKANRMKLRVTFSTVIIKQYKLDM